MKKLLFIFILSLISHNGVASSCQNYLSESNLCFEIEWTKGPLAHQESQFILSFWKETSNSRNFETPDSLEIKLWMPSMGHGSRPVTLEEMGDGQFLVANVFFLMRGDWELLLNVDGQETNIALEI